MKQRWTPRQRQDLILATGFAAFMAFFIFIPLMWPSLSAVSVAIFFILLFFLFADWQQTQKEKKATVWDNLFK